jgi:hypothetical protein
MTIYLGDDITLRSACRVPINACPSLACHYYGPKGRCSRAEWWWNVGAGQGQGQGPFHGEGWEGQVREMAWLGRPAHSRHTRRALLLTGTSSVIQIVLLSSRVTIMTPHNHLTCTGESAVQIKILGCGGGQAASHQELHRYCINIGHAAIQSSHRYYSLYGICCLVILNCIYSTA